MTNRKRLPLAIFGAFWALGIALMIATFVSNPPDATLHGSAALGTSWRGEVAGMLKATSAEILISALLLRPWDYVHSWERTIVTLLTLTVWILVLGGFGLHSGPTTALHTLLLVLLWLGVAGSAVVSALGAHRRKGHRIAP